MSPNLCAGAGSTDWDHPGTYQRFGQCFFGWHVIKPKPTRNRLNPPLLWRARAFFCKAKKKELRKKIWCKFGSWHPTVITSHQNPHHKRGTMWNNAHQWQPRFMVSTYSTHISLTSFKHTKKIGKPTRNVVNWQFVGHFPRLSPMVSWLSPGLFPPLLVPNAQPSNCLRASVSSFWTRCCVGS
jgi:hypothetical protein